MHDAPFTARRHRKAAALEDFEHRHILGQHLSDELFQPGRAPNPDQVSDQVRGDAQFLMRVVDCERNLGPTRLRDDIPGAAHDYLSSAFGKHCRQRHVAGEVHVEEEFYFALAEAAFGGKEPTVSRFVAEPPDRSKHLGAVSGQQRPDLQRCPVTQAFGGGVLGRVHELPRFLL